MRKSISPIDFGNLSLESCPKFTIKGLRNKLKRQEKELLQSMMPYVKIVSRPCQFGGNRYLFICPYCNKATPTIYEDPIWETLSCQNCSDYSYSKQRYKGMIEEKIFK